MKKILLIALVVLLASALWFGKMHRTRECVITNVNDNTLVITVQHPNGWTYNYQADCTENLDEGEVIKVIFNEMTDWEKNYTIIDIVE